MDPTVESALIGAVATIVSVSATAAVAIVGFRSSRSTNQATINAAIATTDKTVDAARDTNRATIDAAHADVRRTLDSTRDGQVADRYSKAIDQLGSDKLDMRIGGVYALEGVARDSPPDHPAVMDVLSVFVQVRSRGRRSTPKSDEDQQSQQLNLPDVQAALTVIARRDISQDRYPVDLSYADLPNAELPGAQLRGAKLTWTVFEWADLGGADLGGAALANVNFTHARLSGADLSGAHAFGTTFDDAALAGTNLTDVDLSAVNIRRADLTQAILTGVQLSPSTNLLGARVPADLPLPPNWTRDPQTGRVTQASTAGGEPGR
jgi:uncharacterized protein YjbI with pentapeptide repeats